MQITNGSVSRTFKPADYEARTVAFSFNLEPNEDVDQATAKVAYLAEKHARHMPTQDEAQTAAPKTRAPRAVPPSVPVAAPGQSVQPGNNTEVSAQTHDPFGVAGEPAQKPLGSADASATVSNSPSPTPAADITDGMLQDAIKAKVASDAKHTPGVMELIQSFTGNPLAKIYSVTDQAKRAEFLAKLAAL